ncbi:hypothetical protein J6590_005195 [Homalodisca vitripennis]|nr:hypothetical protein J6590_005195 [Homalodisca vitripennis]
MVSDTAGAPMNKYHAVTSPKTMVSDTAGAPMNKYHAMTSPKTMVYDTAGAPMNKYHAVTRPKTMDRAETLASRIKTRVLNKLSDPGSAGRAKCENGGQTTIGSLAPATHYLRQVSQRGLRE